MVSEPDSLGYWEKVAGTAQFTVPLKLELVRRNIPNNANILDYGCGYGRTLQQLWENGYRNFEGVDFSPAMVARGRSLYPHLSLRVIRPGRVPFLPSSLDGVFLFAVLTCIKDDCVQRNLISELYGILRPGGIIYVNDFLLTEDERNLARYSQYQEKYGEYGVFEVEGGGVLRHHDRARIRDLLSPFKPREYGEEAFPTMNGHLAQGFYFVGEKVAG